MTLQFTKARGPIGRHQDHPGLPGSDGQMRQVRNLVSQHNARDTSGDFLVAFGVFQKRHHRLRQILAQLAKQPGGFHPAHGLAGNEDIPRRQGELFAEAPQQARDQFGKLEDDMAADLGLAENLDRVFRYTQRAANVFHAPREKRHDPVAVVLRQTPGAVRRGFQPEELFAV